MSDSEREWEVRLEAPVPEPERAQLPMYGCGDNYCRVASPGPVGTNGGCRCDTRAVIAALRSDSRQDLMRAEAALDARDAERTRYVLADAGWKATIRQLDATRDALRKLRAECSTLHIEAVRDQLGNTNAAVLAMRVAEADNILDATSGHAADCSLGKHGHHCEGVCDCGHEPR